MLKKTYSIKKWIANRQWETKKIYIFVEKILDEDNA